MHFADCNCGGCGRCRGRMAGFGAYGAAPPPSYILDMLYGSLTPLRSRLAEIWVSAQSAWADQGVKGQWLGALTQASNMIEYASIDGEGGQKLAMGDLTVAQWSAKPENAADLIESVGREVGVSSYSVARLWREVVVPTVEQLGTGLAKIPKLATDWGPVVAVGLVGLVLLVKLR